MLFFRGQLVDRVWPEYVRRLSASVSLADRFSALCRVDVKELKTYQQLYIYFVPMLTNLGFVNIIVVVVRLHWFRSHLKRLGERSLKHGCSVSYRVAC